MHSFQIQSDLAEQADRVWQQVTELPGINYELMPLMRMTVPDGIAGATLDDVALRTPLGRSWLLLFGVLPVDYDALTIAERGPGNRFLEQSQMLTQKSWGHERIVEPVPGGCRVTDRLRWEGRVPPLGLVYRVMVPVIFGHRHRRLRERFGTLTTAD